MSKLTETASGTRKFLGLQILRITAALMVVVTHSVFYASTRLEKGFHFAFDGATGVDLFFVLSGFVMVYSSTKLVGAPEGWKIFSERRIVRIVPMYWLATTIKLLVIASAAGLALYANWSLGQIVCSYLFIPAHRPAGGVGPVIGVGWTLYFEMFFYALFTVALWLRVNVYKFVGWILIPLGMGSFLYHPSWPAVFFYLNNPKLFEFFYGMLIAKACMSRKHIPVPVALPLMVVGFAGLLAPWPQAHNVCRLLQGVFAAIIIYSMASVEDRLTRVPRWVLYLADASYAIYLFHPMVAPAAPVLLRKLHLVYPWASVAASLCLGVAAGSLIHSLIEAPLTRVLQEKLRKRRKARMARAAVTAAS